MSSYPQQSSCLFHTIRYERCGSLGIPVRKVGRPVRWLTQTRGQRGSESAREQPCRAGVPKVGRPAYFGLSGNAKRA